MISRYLDLYALFQSTLPAGGTTTRMAPRSIFLQRFQSTLPAGGATLASAISWPSWTYFNPRSPQGERRCCWWYSDRWPEFQSTLPAGGATLARSICREYNVFQSTLPAGRATPARSYADAAQYISIHAPRRGSDS